jgi:hypothetical protein
MSVPILILILCLCAAPFLIPLALKGSREKHEPTVRQWVLENHGKYISSDFSMVSRFPYALGTVNWVNSSGNKLSTEFKINILENKLYPDNVS